jgi:hypothetical protein
VLFKNQAAYPDVDVTLLRRVEADDPASIPDRETFVARRSVGIEVYVTREDFDEKEFARAEEAMRSAEEPEPLPEVGDDVAKKEAAADSRDDDTKKSASGAAAHAGSSVTSSSTSIPPSGRR